MQSLKIVFFGTPEFGIPSLEKIINTNHELIAVFTQPDKPSGRGNKITCSPIKNWAIKNKIQIFQPKNFKEKHNIDLLRSLDPDIIIVIAYGIILPIDVLQIPKYGCVNVHASLLPKFRGAAPIQAAILAGEQYTGVTIMKMDIGMDTGDIILKEQIEIQADDTSKTLFIKLAELGSQALIKFINNYESYLINAVSQDNTKATYAPKINKDDALINWHNSAQVIERQVRAYNIWPVAFFITNNIVIKIHQAFIYSANNTSQGSTGEFFIHNKKLLVICNPGILEILSLQVPNGKIISAQDFINSNAFEVIPSLMSK